MNEKLVKTLEKLGTVLVDRRFWIAFGVIVTALGGVFGFSEGQLNAITKALGPDGEAAALFFEKAIQVLVVLVSAVGLVGSWSNRPPSGLDHKEYSVLAKYIEKRYGG